MSYYQPHILQLNFPGAHYSKIDPQFATLDKALHHLKAYQEGFTLWVAEPPIIKSTSLEDIDDEFGNYDGPNFVNVSYAGCCRWMVKSQFSNEWVESPPQYLHLPGEAVVAALTIANSIAGINQTT